jgi:ABC-type uncharacterized transport system substrate-binding protein
VLAAELVQRKAAVIVANQVATPSAQAATNTIPIVFVIVGDPIKGSLRASADRALGPKGPDGLED